MEMLRTVAKAWNIPDIRKKIIFTLLMLLIFRIGSQIPVPGIDREVLSQTFNSETGLFALFNLFSGGAFSNFTIFALSITPYITASIILQLLTIVTGAAGKRRYGRKKENCTVHQIFNGAAGSCAGDRCFHRIIPSGTGKHRCLLRNSNRTRTHRRNSVPDVAG